MSQPPRSSPTPQPSSQGKKYERRNFPAFMRELPALRFRPSEPDPNYQLINPEELNEVLSTADAAAAQRIKDDIAFLDYELLRFFRERDHEAKKQQNRYRRSQLFYIFLATLATVLGSLQALFLSDLPELLPWLAFVETIVALLTVFISQITGREPPLTLWLKNRRRAEQLRREYFRYLMDLPPYQDLQGYERQMMLSRQAAAINAGRLQEEANV